MRQERLERQIELGILPPGTQLAERMWFVPDPITLAPAARATLGKKMELYAGMMENMDFHVGRLIDHLKKIGEYENTIFIVFGDNGAEGTDLFKMIAGQPGTRDFLFAAIKWSQTHPNAWGDPGSYVGYGPMWAQVSMTPFSQYKGWVAEGGIRNALIVSGPAVERPKGSINQGLMHVADIMPTLLDIAGASYPKIHDGTQLPALIGKSWNRMLAGQAESPRNRAGLPCLGDLWQSRGAARGLEAPLAIQALRQGRAGSFSTSRRTPASERISPRSVPTRCGRWSRSGIATSGRTT